MEVLVDLVQERRAAVSGRELDMSLNPIQVGIKLTKYTT
jgi:hypothetical protein